MYTEMKMKKNSLIIIGVVALVILVGAGGFWGGMTYQSYKDGQAQARFFEQRGGQITEGQMPGNQQFPEGMPFQGGGPGSSELAQGDFRSNGTMGQVKSFDGDLLIISTAQDVTTVNLSSDTTIVKSVEGTMDDLQPGVRIMVVGEQDEDGKFNASQITILDDDSLAMPPVTEP
jgi:hypothetical protein